MITPEEMLKLEKDAGVPVLELMERAGTGIADVLIEKYPDKRFLFVCGNGNNGGDGFVAARHLMKAGKPVFVLFIGDEDKLTFEADQNLNRLRKCCPYSLMDAFIKADVVVDCLLGTGFKGELREKASQAVDKINEYPVKVSVDIPSGMDALSGDCSKCVNADLVIALHDIKTGAAKLENKSVTVSLDL